MLIKYAKYCLLCVLLAVGMLAVYEWLNTAVSLDHARQQQKTERERGELLSRLLLVSNREMKRHEVMQLIRENVGNDHVIKEEPDAILVDAVVFRFDSTQSLSKVQFLDTVSE